MEGLITVISLTRLMERGYGLERLKRLPIRPRFMDKHVRARAAVNALEGVGVAEAPRGILIHHYRVDDCGAMQWSNLVIATGHNNLAINRSIEQVARHYVHGERIEEGMLNRVSAVVRSVRPRCLSCLTQEGGSCRCGSNWWPRTAGWWTGSRQSDESTARCGDSRARSAGPGSAR